MLTSTLNCCAQEAFTLKYFGLTIHPFGDSNAHLQPLKLDKQAHLVFNYGLFVGYEKFIYRNNISIKALQGVLSDCSNGLASVTHLGGRIALYRSEKHRFYLGAGPTFIIRNSWNRFGPDYSTSGFFKEANTKAFGDVQYKLIWYGAEIEYDYVISPKNQFSVSLTPGIPLVTTLSFGWKHWISLKDFPSHKYPRIKNKK